MGLREGEGADGFFGLNVLAIHDAFHLYGRPAEYSWDPRNPSSMMFAYPIGPTRDVSASILPLTSRPLLLFSPVDDVFM